MIPNADHPTAPPTAPMIPPPVPASLAALIGPLTHCPHCRYDLTGLPRNHRCPECGQPYDETMLELHLTTSRSDRIIDSTGFTLACAGLGVCWGAMSPGVSVLRTCLLYGLASLAFGAALGTAMVFTVRRGRCYLTPTAFIPVFRSQTLSTPWDAAFNIRAVRRLFRDCAISFDRRLPGWVIARLTRLPVSCNAATAEQLVEYLRKYQDFALAHSRSAPTA